MSQKIIKKIFGFSMSSWITAVLGFIVLIVSTHVYDEHDLGVINFYISVINILCSVFNLALDQGYLRFYPEVENYTRKRLITISVCLTSILAIFFFIICIPLRHYIEKLMFDSDANFILFMTIPISVVGLNFLRFMSLPWRASGNILRYTLIALAYSLSMKAAYMVGLLIGTDWQISIIAYAVTIVGLTILCCLFERKQFKIPAQNDKEIFKDELKFSLPLIPAMIMTNLNNSIPQFVVRIVVGFSNVALYSTAVTVASSLNIIQAGFNTFWSPYVYENYQNNMTQIQKVHEVVVKIMCCVAVAFILGQYLFFAFIKREYSGVTRFLPMLMLAPLTYTIGETTQIGIAISKKSYINIKIYATSLISNLVMCFIFVKINGITGAAISASITSIITLVMKTYYGNKYYKSCKDYKTMFIGIGMYCIAAVVNLLLFDYFRIKMLLLSCILIFMLLIFRIPLIIFKGKKH